MGITVRTATAADLDMLAPMFDQYRQFYEQPSDPELAREFVRARLERCESHVLIAADADGAPAGFCQLYPSFCSLEAAPIFVLYDLYVRPEQRRLGVARALLRAAANLAREQGKVRMDLTTAHTNLSAQALYASEGWVRDTVYAAYSLDTRGDLR